MTTASENPTDKMQDMLCSLSRNWWAFVLRGVLALIIAVLAFVMPAESLGAHAGLRRVRLCRRRVRPRRRDT